MLSVENRFMIKDLHRKGLSISEIARRTGNDRKTIRRILGEPLIRERQPRARRRKIDPFVPYLERRMAEGVLNAPKLLREIRALGYQGGITQLRMFLQPFRQPRAAVVTVRFETEPGEQAQVDWAHFGFIVHEGRRRPLYAFLMTLGWSRAMYVEFTVSADEGWFLRCHLHAFHYFGGIPEEVLHDNLKTAVLSREADGAIHWQPRYLDFAHYYGFAPRVCQPYRAQTKGKVESGIRYLRSSFWPGLRYTTLADLNRQVWLWLDTVANVRTHGTTGEMPFARLPLEGLRPILGRPDYDTSILAHRHSSRDCLVSYQGNDYSVPATHGQQPLLVKETPAGELLFLDAAGEMIACHPLAHGCGQRIVISAHYQGLPGPSAPRRRPMAVQLLPPDDWSNLPAAPEVETRSLRWYDQLLEVAA
ncbi:MAG: IS21 family transposase [Dehalococcoidia bacterium]|nr:IS21 family transposase [Dehalococcoidia bacterium]